MTFADVGNFFTSWFAEVFRVLQLNMPLFNIPIWSFWSGAFLITLSIRIFRSFLLDGTSTYVSNGKGRYPKKGD